jgi:hypothetical protein
MTDDLIRRGDALAAIFEAIDKLRSTQDFNPLQIQMARRRYETAIAAVPAVRAKPPRFFPAEGATFSAMQKQAREHPLCKEGDLMLVWVNEGDLYLNAYPLDLKLARDEAREHRVKALTEELEAVRADAEKDADRIKVMQEVIAAYQDIVDYDAVFTHRDKWDRLKAAKGKLEVCND